jgi:two-component system, NarL family, nitrate/nitrite response regulator NarL
MITQFCGMGSFQVTCTAANGYEVLELLHKFPIDVCLLDINMPELDGIETVRLISQRKLGAKVIMLTTYNDREIISELVHLGVAGYLLKNSDKEELAEAIRKVMRGRHYFSEEVEKIILEGLTEKKTSEIIPLTEREMEVVQLLARKNIMQKTRAHNLAGLIRFAISKGIVK